MFEELKNAIHAALAKPAPPVETVIAACDRLAAMLSDEVHVPLLMQLGMSQEKAAWEVERAKRIMRAPYLEARVKVEFGEAGIPGRRQYTPLDSNETVAEEWRPLGVVLHVSAGNVDALPAYSAIEGLLTGNINLLKLPEGESGLSEGILEALCHAEPALRERVYTFDFRSAEVEKLKALAALSDAVALWGSDEAVCAVRAMAPPQLKLIEWGHRLSFAYVSPDADEAFLRGVAHDMRFTDQLYCSSAQGVFVDTRDTGELYAFAKRFLSILEAEAACASGADAFARAGTAFGLYADSLELGLAGRGKVLRGRGCSVTVYEDSALSASRQFGNCWVRPLPRQEIIAALRPYAGYLQTVALRCAEEERAFIENALLACGAVRITDGCHMNEAYCAMPRDGVYPLTRYMKRVSLARPSGV